MPSKLDQIVSRWPYLLAVRLSLICDKKLYDSLSEKLLPSTRFDLTRLFRNVRRAYKRYQQNQMSLRHKLRLASLLQELHDELGRWGAITYPELKVWSER